MIPNSKTDNSIDTDTDTDNDNETHLIYLNT